MLLSLLLLSCALQAPDGPLVAPFEGVVGATAVYDHAPGTPGQQGFDGVVVEGLDGHLGWDWPLPMGTPVRAVAAGRVIASGEEAFDCPLTGERTTDQQVVRVRHELSDTRRLTTAYAHLSRLDVGVGDTVAAGEVLGLSGASGCASGPHLHFAVWQALGGPAAAFQPIDPYAGPEPLWKRGEAPLTGL